MVSNSRHQKRSNGVWRRRLCTKCKATFTSIEIVDLQTSFIVNSKGHLEPFLRDKILISLYDSLKHRKTAIGDASALTDTVISKVYVQTQSSEISLVKLESIIQSVLNNFDHVAATHYQAYYIDS